MFPAATALKAPSACEDVKTSEGAGICAGLGIMFTLFLWVGLRHDAVKVV